MDYDVDRGFTPTSRHEGQLLGDCVFTAVAKEGSKRSDPHVRVTVLIESAFSIVRTALITRGRSWRC